MTMRRSYRHSLVWLFGFVATLLCQAVAQGGDNPPPRPYQPQVQPASEEGAQAIGAFQVPDGWSVNLVAAEPMLANPVALCIDEQGRFYVVETFRHYAGVTDIRRHMDWLDDDLSSRTVDDRRAMLRAKLGPDVMSYAVEHDRIRLIEDTDGDRIADRATVFSDGYDELAAGLGAGVLARRGDVYYTCIPALWKLRDEDGDGFAESRQILSEGYGVHIAFLGHDLHGLRFGPDGKLYFSIGDRGFHVDSGEAILAYPDTGAVLRCDPDGSNLEVFAYGFRNPQELVFDQYGNLFSGDNNSDSGDQARLVHIVESGDSGWRIGYQYLEYPNSRGPWNAEKLWYPHFEGQAAYIVPPVANLGDGPSGLTRDPGTGLPEAYRDNFFLCDFRGSPSQSGIRAFAVEPKGASFRMIKNEKFLWSVLATDVDFGYDGSLYLTDWIEGWRKTGKGRLYRLTPPETGTDSVVEQVGAIMAQAWEDREQDELIDLLSHPDQRIRQEAQLTLAERGVESISAFNEVAETSENQLARLHAIWGLGQIGRTERDALAVLDGLLGDDDAEVRAQAVKVLGDESRVEVVDTITDLLEDASPRVRFFAAVALGKLGAEGAVEEIVAMIRRDAAEDTYLRHAGVMGLLGTATTDRLVALADDANASARMAGVLTLRRRREPAVAEFLSDNDPLIVVEAARAIFDEPIEGAMAKLARLDVAQSDSEPLLRRVINANVRVGDPDSAGRLTTLALRDDVPEAIRVEAIKRLANWAQPENRDPLVGVWRPLKTRNPAPAAQAVRANLDAWLAPASSAIRQEAIRSVAMLRIAEAGPTLVAIARETQVDPETRVAAIQGLDRLGDPRLAEVVDATFEDDEPTVRIEAQRLLIKLQPEQALPIVEQVLQDGTIAERQGAIRILGSLRGDQADMLLLDALKAHINGSLEPELALEVLEAAQARQSGEIATLYGSYDQQRSQGGTADPLDRFAESLYGGDAANGSKIFYENSAVACLRCHMIGDQGGQVGPNLTEIARQRDRSYLLRSIAMPSAEIAEGYQTIIAAMEDGRIVTGVLRGDDGENLTVITAEAEVLTLPKDQIEESRRGESSMPADIITKLSRSELRDLVEFLSTLK